MQLHHHVDSRNPEAYHTNEDNDIVHIVICIQLLFKFIQLVFVDLLLFGFVYHGASGFFYHAEFL